VDPGETGLSISIFPVTGMAEVREGDDIVALVVSAAAEADLEIRDGDVVVVASKVLSKAEGRRLADDPAPGVEARRIAAITGHDPGEVEAILAESTEVLRAKPEVLVVETRQGFVCANAGIDRSNVGISGTALLLPEDPDASATRVREGLRQRLGVDVAVVVSDTFGRPFRNGLVNVAIGVSGMRPIRDYRGQADSEGRNLRGTELAVADELASAAELVMNKLDRVPVAVIRGYQHEAAEGSGRQLLRDAATDYFR